eukprot:scaffold1384_cov116-Cylindrotheca_fusiformis.AAC.5
MRSASPLSFGWPDSHDDDLLGDSFLERDAATRSLGNKAVFTEESSASSTSPTHHDAAGGLQTDSLMNGQDSNLKKRSMVKTESISTSRRKKKPKGMPKRPLSAYNLFFQSERAAVQAKAEKESPSTRLGFEGLGKIIGKQWRELSAEDRKEFEKLAAKDRVRYSREMEKYNQEKSRKIVKDEQEKFYSSMGGQNENDSGIGQDLRDEMWEQLGAVPDSSYAGRDKANLPQRYPLIYSAAKSSVDVVAPQASPLPQHLHFPPPPPGRCAIDVKSSMLPPGMEIILSDKDGNDRKYSVQYKCYSMPREEAHNFIESVAAQRPNLHTAPETYVTSGSSQTTKGASQFGVPWDKGLSPLQQEPV